MKKAGWFFVILLLLTVFAGLFYKEKDNNPDAEKTVFLFDTYCTVTAYGRNSQSAVDEVLKRLEEIHRITDFFSENSEVYKINSAKADEKVFVGEDMKKILAAAAEIEKESNGAFDISIAPVLKLWDFENGGRVPSGTEIQRALSFVGRGSILFDEQSGTVTKTSDEAKIDLGGIAKGYAGDVAVKVLENFGVTGAIVDLGGNICCVGENPNTKDGKWHIGLQKPFSPTGEYDQVIEVAQGAVVTSGTYQRYFEDEEKMYHHIIDPKTGYPKEQGYDSVTLVTDSSLYGDCLATACFILGEDEGRKLAEKFDAEIYFK